MLRTESERISVCDLERDINLSDPEESSFGSREWRGRMIHRDPMELYGGWSDEDDMRSPPNPLPMPPPHQVHLSIVNYTRFWTGSSIKRLSLKKETALGYITNVASKTFFSFLMSPRNVLKCSENLHSLQCFQQIMYLFSLSVESCICFLGLGANTTSYEHECWTYGRDGGCWWGAG